MNRLSDLVNAFVDGGLTADDERELGALLAVDEEARRTFVRAMHQEESLREMLAPAVVTTARGPSSRTAWTAGALVACVAIAVAAYVLLAAKRAPASPSPVVAETPKLALAPKPLESDSPRTPGPPPPAPATLAPPEPPVPPPPKEQPKPPDESAPPAPEPTPPPAPGPAPRRETAVAVATLDRAEGEVRVGDTPVKPGQAILAGQSIKVVGAATLTFSGAIRAEVEGDVALRVASARSLFLTKGTLSVSMERAEPMALATPHAEATVTGTQFSLSCAAATRLAIVRGKAQISRPGDKRPLEITAGCYAVAGRGMEWSARRITRDVQTAGAILLTEDFSDARAVEKTWRVTRGAFPLTTSGQIEVDMTPRATEEHSILATEEAFAVPLRVALDVEFTHRPKGMLGAARLHSWREGASKDFVHADLMDDWYWLNIGDSTVRVDAPRKYPRRERWTIELDSDGGVRWLVNGEEIVKGRRGRAIEEFHVSLTAKAMKDATAGARVLFDNVLVEQLKR